MTYQITARIETVYDEADIIRMMLETGEYGFGLNDITTNAMIDFIGRLEFGSDVMYNNTQHATEAKYVKYSISGETGDYLVRTFDGISEKVRDAYASSDTQALQDIIQSTFGE